MEEEYSCDINPPAAAKVKGSKKGGLISKTWERCKSLGGKKGGSVPLLALKSKSWPRGLILNVQPRRVRPDGCFSIYVGPEREKFTIKTEYVNHPLFKTLLEEAECEYGYSCDGPITLPCAVDHFIAVLTEMEDDSADEYPLPMQHACNFVARRPHSSTYHLLTPSRLLLN